MSGEHAVGMTRRGLRQHVVRADERRDAIGVEREREVPDERERRLVDRRELLPLFLHRLAPRETEIARDGFGDEERAAAGVDEETCRTRRSIGSTKRELDKGPVALDEERNRGG